MKPLLVLVDLQEDFLGDSGLHPHRDSLVWGSATLLGLFRQNALTVAHVHTSVTLEPDTRMPHWKTQDLRRCVSNTPGHKTPESLAPLQGESLVEKTGFSPLGIPQFEQLLRSDRSQPVVICGVHLHACVMHTALAFWEQGFKVWIAEDATGSNNPMFAESTRLYLEDRGIEFLNSPQIVEHIASGHPKTRSDTTTHHKSCFPDCGNLRKICKAALPSDRVSSLERLRDILVDSSDALSSLISATVHKPIRFARKELEATIRLIDSLGSNQEAALACSNYRSGSDFWQLQPHGCVAVITPWNNPVFIPLGKIIPAVLGGNSVLWKPAPEALPVSLRLIGLLERAGIPKGLVSLVEGHRAEAIQLMRHPEVNAVTLTGSETAGRTASIICASRGIPLQAELGGNNAAIVGFDSDLDLAASEIASGAFDMAGQRCTANRRVIVHQSCANAFIESIVARTLLLTWGQPLHPETRIGPVVSTKHARRIRELIDRSVQSGHRTIRPFGEHAPDTKHPWVSPTIMICEDPNCELVQEESFGPVLVIQPARDWKQAIQLCNGVRQGLVASVFSNNPATIRDFLEEATAGILKVNTATADADPCLPFGGWKTSGIGLPEHGIFDAFAFGRVQTRYNAPPI